MSNGFEIKFGALLKEKREAITVSREDLAKILNISRVTLTNIEKGDSDISFKNVMSLCPILDFSINEIVSLYDDEAIQNELKNKPEAIQSALSKFL